METGEAILDSITTAEEILETPSEEIVENTPAIEESIEESEISEEETTIEEVEEEVTADDESSEPEESEEETTEEPTEEESTDEEIAEETEVVEEEVATEEEMDNEEQSISTETEEIIETTESIPETFAKKEEKEDKEEEASEDSDKEEDKEEDYACGKKKKDYSLLYSELQKEYSELNEKYQALVEFKLQIEEQEKDALINSFYMLSDEDKADVISNKSNYSLEEIEAKLSVICVRKKVSFDNEENNTVKEEGNNVMTYTVNDEVDSSIPAWFKACMNTRDSKK